MKPKLYQILLAFVILLSPNALIAQISFHTRSIVACDPDAQECGIAVVSFPSGVPAIVPVGEPGVIVANQATPSLATARDIIERIQMGELAPTALEGALAADPTFESRQIGVAALNAGVVGGVTVATFTGANPGPETCELTGRTYAVQANVQTSSAVCGAMAGAFESAAGSLARRLLASLKAGTPVGQDFRGEFSASIKVFSDVWVLASLTELSADASVDRSRNWENDLEFGLNAYLSVLTPGDDRDLVELTRSRAQEIQKIMHKLGFYKGPKNGVWSDDSEAALIAMAGRNTFFPKGTVEMGGVRFINGAWSDYIVEGFKRGTLSPPFD